MSVADPMVEILNHQRRHSVDRQRIRATACAAFHGGNGRGEVITILLAGDRKLLQLLYTHLGSANDWSELRAAYRRYCDAS